MPAVAVVAAGFSVAAGAAAIAAGSAVVGGLMVAGGVMSGLGAITGNKTLSKLGMVASLAGGVGGMMTGAWDATSQGVAQAASESAPALDAGTGMVDPLGSAAEGAGMAGGAMPTPVAGGDVVGTPLPGLDTAAGGTPIAGAGTPMPDLAGAGTPPVEVAGAPSTDLAGAGSAQQGLVQSANPSGLAAANPVSQQATALPTSATATPDVSQISLAPQPVDPAYAQQVSAANAQPTTDGGASMRYQLTGDDAKALYGNNAYTGRPDLPKWYETGLEKLGSGAKAFGEAINKNAGLATVGAGLVGGAMKSYSDDAMLKKQQEYAAKLRQQYSDSVRGLRMPTYNRA